ncbi:MAG: type II toxin-antitoxin system RelE/ParE family toxin [Planctomycetes bacterium]|nr:type II toxin-antitoxin system RelE/ParE family toxin [Planctomycetota bacterium]
MLYSESGMNVTLTPAAAREFDALPLTIQARMIRVFERLRDFPAVSGAKPLRRKLAGRYRMRTGDYRIQFRVERDAVTVEKVGHRDRFYED